MIKHKDIEKKFGHWVENCSCGWFPPKGWSEVIWDLCHELTDILNKHNLSDQRLLVEQVKEKFGGLRFYWTLTYKEDEFIDAIYEEIDNAVNRAEKKCWKICMICGAPGTSKTHNHWVSTLCEKHHKEKAERLS